MSHLVQTIFSGQFLQSLMDINGKQLAITRQKPKPDEKREGVNGTTKSSRQETIKCKEALRLVIGDSTVDGFVCCYSRDLRLPVPA